MSGIDKISRLWIVVVLCFIATLGQARAADLNPDFSKFVALHNVLADSISAPKPFTGDLFALATKVHDKYEHSFRYISSEKQYGSKSYWPTRGETMESHAADCKGFAVAAYYDLLDAGVSPDAAFIWVVKLKKTGEIHAVVRVGDYVIDRMVDRVITLKEANGIYMNIYRFNRTGWTTQEM